MIEVIRKQNHEVIYQMKRILMFLALGVIFISSLGRCPM